MLAVVFDGEATLRGDYPQPKAREGEALVAVRMAGVCTTDLEILKGYMNFRGVMGHEFVGQVVSVGSRADRAWTGKRVVAEINCVCGRCDMCRRGLSNHCRHRTVLGIDSRDGAFAEYVAVPVRNLTPVPDSISDEAAVFTEPLAAAYQVVRQIQFDSGDKVVVLGDGRLGQLIVRVLKPLLRRIVLVGKHPARLEAAEKEGVQTAELAEFVPAAQSDIVIDATGSPAGFDLAMRTVRPRGTIVLKSTYSSQKAAEGKLNLAPLVIHEVTVVGSRCGPFPDALRLLAAGEVNVAALVSARFPLRQGIEALAAAADPDKIKVLIDVR